MTDISTLWNTVRGDWSLAGKDLAAGNDIVTSALISLFTDRVAGPDDVPSDHTIDPRGWWADDPVHPIGSRLWLLNRAKRTQQTLESAIAYAREATSWLIDDGVCSRIDVSAEWTTEHTLGLWLIFYSPGGGALSKLGVQNLFNVPHVQAWGWNSDQAIGQWVPIAPSAI